MLEITVLNKYLSPLPLLTIWVILPCSTTEVKWEVEIVVAGVFSPKTPPLTATPPAFTNPINEPTNVVVDWTLNLTFEVVLVVTTLNGWLPTSGIRVIKS